MADAYWPSNLPSECLAGVRYQPGPQVIRTRMDSGAVQVRRVASAAPADFDAPIRFTREQVIVFEAWFFGTLAGGTLVFRWLHPVTGVEVRMRFREDRAPKWADEIVGTKTSGTMTATFALEILP